MFYYKRHDSGEKIITAICDSNLIGKKFVEGEKCILVSEYFFKGELVDNNVIAEIVAKAESLNVIGKNAVEICIDLGVVNKENVAFISSVPYTIVFELGNG